MHIQRNFLVGIIFSILFITAGCAPFKHKKNPQGATPVHEKVGTVVLVNEDQHFVLIDCGSSYLPRAGEALKTFNNGKETSVVTVTEEKRSPFIVADIIKGIPQKKDSVYN